MNETLGRGYARIEAIRAARGEPPPAGAAPDPAPPPPDEKDLLYRTLFFAGIAFLLPYNSFIMAVDFFRDSYPNSSIMFDMSAVYIASAFVAVIANNLMLEMFTHNARIIFGILVALLTMVFVAVSSVGLASFFEGGSYAVTLVALAVAAFGCTVQQASYYGFTSCLPARYTQAVMAGESAAGFFVSLDRIFTKLLFSTPQRNTFVFFLIAISMQVVHCAMHYAMMHHPRTLHYLRRMQESRRRIVLEPSEDAGLMETEGESYGVLKLQTSPPPAGTVPPHPTNDGDISGFSFANPVYSPTATTAPVLPLAAAVTASTIPPHAHRTSYKVEDVVFKRPDRPTTWHGVKHAVAARWLVARAIYPYMVSIGLAYFVTLSLYPGIASEVVSCRFGSWMPIIVMSCFNIFDFLGKIAGAWPYEWSRSQLLMGSGLRLLLVPLLLLCAAPRHSPHIKGDVYPIMFSVVLGFTNGLFGSVPMILAPARVSQEHREIAGNIMTLSYNVGLMSGSLVSYLLLGMLGAAVDACALRYPSGPLQLPTTPSTTTASSALTTLAQNLTKGLFHVH